MVDRLERFSKNGLCTTGTNGDLITYRAGLGSARRLAFSNYVNPLIMKPYRDYDYFTQNLPIDVLDF